MQFDKKKLLSKGNFFSLFLVNIENVFFCFREQKIPFADTK